MALVLEKRQQLKAVASRRRAVDTGLFPSGAGCTRVERGSGTKGSVTALTACAQRDEGSRYATG